MTDLSPSKHPAGSRAVHRIQIWSAASSATGVAALVSTLAILAAIVTDQREQILIWFEALSAAVTLVMVFVLQHTQNRQQVALQLKLDELLRALPAADDQFIRLERAPQPQIDGLVDEEDDT